jgi:hypothetical protein
MNTLTHTWKGKPVSEAQYNAYAARAKTLPPGSGPVAPADDSDVIAQMQAQIEQLKAQITGKAAPKTAKAEAPAVPAHETLIAERGLAWAKGGVNLSEEAIVACARVAKTGKPEIVAATGQGITHVVVYRREDGKVRIHNLYTPGK